MKKLVALALAFVMCLALCACGKMFSEKLFDGDGIYQEYDSLPDEEKEQFLNEATKDGYAVGFDSEGRITLTKDGKTFVLGESKKTPKPVA